MDYDVLEARYVRDYVVWLRFRDGTSGEIDLAHSLRGPVFEPLKDLDLAPETLHDKVRTANPPSSDE